MQFPAKVSVLRLSKVLDFFFSIHCNTKLEAPICLHNIRLHDSLSPKCTVLHVLLYIFGSFVDSVSGMGQVSASRCWGGEGAGCHVTHAFFVQAGLSLISWMRRAGLVCLAGLAIVGRIGSSRCCVGEPLAGTWLLPLILPGARERAQTFELANVRR